MKDLVLRLSICTHGVTWLKSQLGGRVHMMSYA